MLLSKQRQNPDTRKHHFSLSTRDDLEPRELYRSGGAWKGEIFPASLGLSSGDCISFSGPRDFVRRSLAPVTDATLRELTIFVSHSRLERTGRCCRSSSQPARSWAGGSQLRGGCTSTISRTEVPARRLRGSSSILVLCCVTHRSVSILLAQARTRTIVTISKPRLPRKTTHHGSPRDLCCYRRLSGPRSRLGPVA